MTGCKLFQRAVTEKSARILTLSYRISIYAMYTGRFRTLIVKGQNGRSLSAMPCMSVERKVCCSGLDNRALSSK